jgi:hypothetical protein
MSSICTFFRHTFAVFCIVSQNSAVPLPKGFGLALYLEDTWLESRPGQYHDHTSAASCQTLTIRYSQVINSFDTTQPVLLPPPPLPTERIIVSSTAPIILINQLHAEVILEKRTIPQLLKKFTDLKKILSSLPYSQQLYISS